MRKVELELVLTGGGRPTKHSWREVIYLAERGAWTKGQKERADRSACRFLLNHLHDAFHPKSKSHCQASPRDAPRHVKPHERGPRYFSKNPLCLQVIEGKLLTQPHEAGKELACHHFLEFVLHVSICKECNTKQLLLIRSILPDGNIRNTDILLHHS